MQPRAMTILSFILLCNAVLKCWEAGEGWLPLASVLDCCYNQRDQGDYRLNNGDCDLQVRSPFFHMLWFPHCFVPPF